MSNVSKQENAKLFQEAQRVRQDAQRQLHSQAASGKSGKADSSTPSYHKPLQRTR